MLIEQILESDNLHKAWKRVRQNKGAAGIDGMLLEDYPRWAQAHGQNVRRGLMRVYYCPRPVRRVEIAKPNGGIRLLGIPTINDRVIQQAISQTLEALIDPYFSEHSYGFRPKRSAHGAVKAVQEAIKDGYRYAVDIDLSKLFDEVDRDLLMHRLSKRVDDKRVLKLIGKYLRAGVSNKGKVQATHVLFKTMAKTAYSYLQANQSGSHRQFGYQDRHQFKGLLSASENQGCADWDQQSVA